jgi:hypothetical protein
MCPHAVRSQVISQERVFHDAYVIIPGALQSRPEWQDLIDPQTRFIRSSENFRVRYDELASLRFDQLRNLFFSVPLMGPSGRPRQELQKRAAEAFLHLPISRIAQLLVGPELRLDENLKSHANLVNFSELQLAQYYADTLALHQRARTGSVGL